MFLHMKNNYFSYLNETRTRNYSRRLLMFYFGHFKFNIGLLFISNVQNSTHILKSKF